MVPSLSLAVAAIVMVAGIVNVIPSAGLVMDTLGGVLLLPVPTALAARNAFNRPPDATNPFQRGIWSTLSSNRDLISATDNVGFICASSAATPATCGVAMIVPDRYT